MMGCATFAGHTRKYDVCFTPNFNATHGSVSIWDACSNLLFLLVWWNSAKKECLVELERRDFSLHMWTIRGFATALVNEQPLVSTTRSGAQMVITQNSHSKLPRHIKLEPCSTGFSMCVRVPVLVALHMARCALHFLHHLSNSMRSARKMAGSSMPLIWKRCKAVLRAQWCVLMHWRWRLS